QKPGLVARFACEPSSVCAVARSAADHLVQRALIDGDADIAFEPRNIFGENTVGEAAIERLDHAFGVFRTHVERGHDDVGDAEDHLARRLRTFRLAVGILWRAKDSVDSGSRERARGLTALEAAQGFDLEMLSCCNIGKRRAAFELVEDTR